MSQRSNSTKKKKVGNPPASSSNESKEDMIDKVLKFRGEVNAFTEQVIEMSESMEYPNHFTGHILSLIASLVLQADDRDDYVKTAIWGASFARIFTRYHPHNIKRDGTIRRKRRKQNYDPAIRRHLKALAEYDINIPDVDWALIT